MVPAGSLQAFWGSLEVDMATDLSRRRCRWGSWEGHQSPGPLPPVLPLNAQGRKKALHRHFIREVISTHLHKDNRRANAQHSDMIAILVLYFKKNLQCPPHIMKKMYGGGRGDEKSSSEARSEEKEFFKERHVLKFVTYSQG